MKFYQYLSIRQHYVSLEYMANTSKRVSIIERFDLIIVVPLGGLNSKEQNERESENIHTHIIQTRSNTVHLDV